MLLRTTPYHMAEVIHGYVILLHMREHCVPGSTLIPRKKPGHEAKLQLLVRYLFVFLNLVPRPPAQTSSHSCGDKSGRRPGCEVGFS